MFQSRSRSMVDGSEAPKAGQSNRLLFVLVVLLVGIAILVVSDRQIWFGSNQLILDSDDSEPSAAARTNPAPSAAAAARTNPAPTQKKHSTVASLPHAKVPAVAVTRTVLPPMNVEVVAGNTRASNSKIEHTPSITVMTDAANPEPLAREAAPASYPLLAQHMNVQGSVVLKAVIGTDGIIQDLHILSGPGILAAAAQQAVREWHFKPIVQDGQPVESMAKIIVNFTIKISDNTEKMTLAESRADRLIITR